MLVRFDFSDGEGTTPRYFTNAEQEVTAYQLPEVLPALQKVQDAVHKGKWAAGYLAYEAAPAFDAAMQTQRPGAMPLVHFGIFDHPAQDVWEASDSVAVGQWQSSTSHAQYIEDIGRIKEAIFEGLTYQVNYTMRLHAALSGDDRYYYLRLLKNQRAPYCAYVDAGRYHILSVSPELFFRIEGSRIITRPMKGTIRRGRFWQEDQALRMQLAESKKDQAENVMIVDLLRNDLGRVAGVGSVQVEELF